MVVGGVIAGVRYHFAVYLFAWRLVTTAPSLCLEKKLLFRVKLRFILNVLFSISIYVIWHVLLLTCVGRTQAQA